ncbi:hypothetical protein [Demequina gelatinilytica]|uniref:hypothetical protein n=1 Tax=Demequina gelatinilytica TaxID=1638980 RepID=UPI000781230D|nr:hypothetical protein [Demequina gelatinilytica]
MFTDDFVTLVQSHRLAAASLSGRAARPRRARAFATLRRRVRAAEVRVLTRALAHASDAEARLRLA